jgi:hypothetical protein
MIQCFIVDILGYQIFAYFLIKGRTLIAHYALSLVFSSSSHYGPSAIAPEPPQPMVYLHPLILIQHNLDITVFLINRHRSLTVDVLITFGSIVNSPKVLKRLRDKASQ